MILNILGVNLIKSEVITMSEKFRNTVNTFKSENGNANFTQKDMLIYLVSKIDKLECKIVPRWIFISTTSLIFIVLGYLIFV